MTSNPYEFSQESSDVTGVPVVGDRPSGITVVGVITIILSSLGLFGVLGGVAGEVFGKAMSQAIITQAEQSNDPGLKAQAKLQKQTLAVAQKYRLPNYIVLAFTFVVCLALLIGAIMLLMSSPKGRNILLIMFLAVIIGDVGKTVLQYFVQSATFEAMGETMPEAFKDDPNMDEETAEKVGNMMGGVMKVGRIVGIVVLFGWLLLKMIFYFLGWRYLKKPEVEAWYESRGETTFSAT